jgi:3-dehydroquinate dehydratase
LHRQRAGLTRHGEPLHDAINAMPFPVLEIHMSNIAARAFSRLWTLDAQLRAPRAH